MLTALYSFRMIFITFFGEAKTEPVFREGKLMTIPLIILAVLSVVGGFIELPASMGTVHIFSDLVNNTLPGIVIKKVENVELLFQLVSAMIALSGIFLAYRFYFKKPKYMETFRHSRLNHFFETGFGFDKVYDRIIVNPIVWLAEIDKKDIFDYLNVSIARLALLGNRVISLTENGKLRWYILSFAIGIALILTFMINK